MENKRLFFGVEIAAPWPQDLPKGRLLDENHRHLTLAFLGNVSYQPLRELLDLFPKITLKIAPVGYFDACLTLPPYHPHVIAWHAKWFENGKAFEEFQRILSDWLSSHGYPLDKRPWMPHVTLCRQPFDPLSWIKAFSPLPFIAGGIHLYESVGNLQYVSLWNYPLKSPFEEINHTADLAFKICGENLHQLYDNAFTALAFKIPGLIEFYQEPPPLQSLEEMIIELNAIVSRADQKMGCSIKAISFHGQITPLSEGILEWEMIVDV